MKSSAAATCLVLFSLLATTILGQPGPAHPPEPQSSGCVVWADPPGAPAVALHGTYSQETFITSPACQAVIIAGNRGIYPNNNTQVPLDQPNGTYLRIKQAFDNMLYEAAIYGATYLDCAEVLVLVTDMVTFRPVVNLVQSEIWGLPTPEKIAVYPPRTIVQVTALDGLTCLYAPSNYTQGVPGPGGQASCPGGFPVGDIMEVKGTFYVKPDATKKRVNIN